MRHCCSFDADDIYCLADTDWALSRTLSIGFCPICQKPVAELAVWNADGVYKKISWAGIKAEMLAVSLGEEILYSMRELNYKKFRRKPYGWKYGINKQSKSGKVKQYACDFYGSKELVKKT